MVVKNQMLSPQIDSVTTTNLFLEPFYWELLEAVVVFPPNIFWQDPKTKLSLSWRCSHIL